MDNLDDLNSSGLASGLEDFDSQVSNLEMVRRAGLAAQQRRARGRERAEREKVEARWRWMWKVFALGVGVVVLVVTVSLVARWIVGK